MHAFPPTDQQSPRDIFINGVNEAKCLVGRFGTVWDASVTGSLEALVIIPSQIDDTCQKDDTFRVSFQLKKEYLDQLALIPNDKFRLSLRGARLKKLSEIQESSTIAMELWFSDGLLIQWKGRDGELKAMDTWIGMCLPRNYRHGSITLV